jgi:hypothetical protein
MKLYNYKEVYVYDMLNKVIEQNVVLWQKMVNAECLKKEIDSDKMCQIKI